MHKISHYQREIIKNDLNIAPLIGAAALERRMARNAVSLTSICFSHLIRSVMSCMMLITSGTSSLRYQLVVARGLLFSVEATVEAISVAETKAIYMQSWRNIFRMRNM